MNFIWCQLNTSFQDEASSFFLNNFSSRGIQSLLADHERQVNDGPGVDFSVKKLQQASFAEQLRTYLFAPLWIKIENKARGPLARRYTFFPSSFPGRNCICKANFLEGIVWCTNMQSNAAVYTGTSYFDFIFFIPLEIGQQKSAAVFDVNGERRQGFFPRQQKEGLEK